MMWGQPKDKQRIISNLSKFIRIVVLLLFRVSSNVAEPSLKPGGFDEIAMDQNILY